MFVEFELKQIIFVISANMIDGRERMSELSILPLSKGNTHFQHHSRYKSYSSIRQSSFSHLIQSCQKWQCCISSKIKLRPVGLALIITGSTVWCLIFPSEPGTQTCIPALNTLGLVRSSCVYRSLWPGINRQSLKHDYTGSKCFRLTNIYMPG